MDNQKDKRPTIGIPRALLYHRFKTLWKTYFEVLGVTTVVSPPTNREILESGSALAIDETCLSANIYLGHVQALIGKCDYIFISRYSNLGRQEAFCTRFEGMYDQTRNIFRASNQKFISCNVDVRKNYTEAEAYAQLGQSLGFSAKAAKHAYETAVKADAKEWNRKSFDFNIGSMEFVTREASCGRCSNNCEIICVYRDGQLIDFWGNRCERGAVKIPAAAGM